MGVLGRRLRMISDSVMRCLCKARFHPEDGLLQGRDAQPDEGWQAPGKRSGSLVWRAGLLYELGR